MGVKIMIKMKTISGHYGSVYNLEHNNRVFIPSNCITERLPRNHYLVMAGVDVPFDLPDLRFTDEMWLEYRRLVAAYWQDRALMNAEEYERLRRKLRELQQYRPYWRMDDCGVLGLAIGLIFYLLSLQMRLWLHGNMMTR